MLTASIAGIEEAPLDSIYAATKHGLIGFMRAQAPRLARHGVRVNALCPGFVHTDLTDDIRGMLEERQIDEMDVGKAVAGFHTILDARSTGQAWPVLPGLPVEPFKFGQVRGLRDVYPDPATVRRRSAPGATPQVGPATGTAAQPPQGQGRTARRRGKL
jgi:NAD(P)-dependent dehydrogenase (short-subunit alcohol dehydrogenase family)